MKKEIAAVLILAAYAVGQTAKAPQPAKTPKPSAEVRYVGRYQIFFSPHARADVYLVDTETGQIWKPVVITSADGAPQVWMYQDRIDNETGFDSWSALHHINPPAPQ